MVRDILARFDEQARKNVAPEPGIDVERTDGVVRIVGLWDCVLYSSLTQSTADSEIAKQIAYFQGRDKKFEWKLYGHDCPSDLDERLRRSGFEAEDPETLLAFDLQGELPSASPPPDVTIESVCDAAGLADLAAVGERAFGVDYAAMNREFLARLALGTVSFYVAYKDGEPVCAGRLETPRNGEFAGLYGGGTVPEQRGQGIYRSLVGARAKEALNQGYRFLTVDAADTSLPILRCLGFVALTTVRAWVWKPR